jgi:hypothetical protein
VADAVNDLVNEALACWARVAGIDLGDDDIRNWDKRKHLEDLNHSRELDLTGLTTFMMLRGLADELLEGTKILARDLLVSPGRVEDRLGPLRGLRALVEDARVVELVESFVARLWRAADDYGVRGEDRRKAIGELLASKYSLGFLRRDALLSMERLEHHQFVQGRADDVELRKNENVFEFLNANSAVAAAVAQQVSGISMVLVRDPEIELASYFAFLVRNGETVTMLTDREEGPHPAFQRMSRRPDRNLESRAAKHWFPYQLLDLERGSDDRLRVHRTALVRYNSEPVQLARVGDLEPEQFVWAVLMHDLIRNKYGRQDARLPELSYTGEMVVEPHVLLGPGSELARAVGYRPLEAPPLTSDEVTAARDDGQWDVPSTRFNAWMEERYGGRVPADYLSVVGDEQVRLLQERAASLLPPTKEDRWGELESAPRVGLSSLSPVTFGTREKLQSDRLWVGRVNKMHYVQELAEAEYHAEREGVYAWWRGACHRNAELFLDGLARGELPAPCYTTRDPEDSFHVGYARTTIKNCLRRWLSVREWREDTYGFVDEEAGSVLLARARRMDGVIRCYDDGGPPAVVGRFRPTCPESLALFAGVGVAELPWPLQHWYDGAPYSGNSILRRIEPSDWVLKNPWMSSRSGQHSMAVTAFLSRRSLRARRSRLGLPPLKL